MSSTNAPADIKLPMFSENDDPMSSKGLLGERDNAPPTNATSAVEPPKKMWPGYIIMVWIALSSSVILQNAYILNKLGFKFPIFLTTFHLVYATIGVRILARTTHLLDGLKDAQMTWDRYIRNIVPIGALFSASLVFSNLAYITLSVSFIQMLKAFTSVAVLGMSVLAGLEKMNPRTFIIVIAISSGVALASYGEINFVMSGFVYQSLGIAFEAARLVAIQKLLTGLKLTPLVALYNFAPVCAALNSLLIPFFEGAAPFNEVLDKVGLPFLVLNASTAFLLNVAVVFLIGSASSLVLTLSGVIKDILLVAGSVLIMGSTVTFTQMLGYSIALAGLVVFKTKQEIVDQHILKIRSLLSR
ncbi:triose-phosphate transporter family-domain-containing protein [Leucosporidium creatinivorum]|uniref:Triose-phosphate transporter family-domain-containing protein n=1 Tax=Leucosporidium creatinivorum TaxID=106004 RepID=A0A1Y2ECH5_9BASI|nr:triose-phosphate transporter family-domain-containing protein [Leucosporidium creatinivorum]